eukprot:SAG22_NODE_17381_length_306_cov_0.710145_1_plen_95_part_01
MERSSVCRVPIDDHSDPHGPPSIFLDFFRVNVGFGSFGVRPAVTAGCCWCAGSGLATGPGIGATDTCRGRRPLGTAAAVTGVAACLPLPRPPPPL